MVVAWLNVAKKNAPNSPIITVWKPALLFLSVISFVRLLE
jgi:hypothetical protein